MKKFKNTCLLFLCAIIWGFSFVAQTVGASSGIGSFTFNAVKFAIGALCLVIVIPIFEKRENNKNKTDVKMLLGSGTLAGAMLFLASYMQQHGMELGVKIGVENISGLSGFITGIYIVLIPIFRFIGGKRTSINTWIGALCAVIGLYLLCVTDGLGSITVSHIFLFACSVLFAFHIIIVDKISGSVSSLKFSLCQFVTVAILSAVCAIIFEEPKIEQISASITPLLYSGILSVGVAYTCQTIAQKNADPTFAGIVFSTESVFSAVGGAIILHEIMTGKAYLGCAIIFAGIVISQIEFKKHNKKSQVK